MREPTAFSFLGRPLLDAAAAFLVGGLVGFVSSQSGVLEPRDHVLRHGEITKVDRNRDGVADAWFIHRGQEPARSKVDRNFDGKPDEWHFYSGTLLVRSESDDDFDGRTDSWVTYRAENPVESTIDTDYNGVPDYTAEYENGIIRRGRWHPNGGPIEREERYVDGVIREEFEVHPDGSTTLVRTYDAFGRARSVE